LIKRVDERSSDQQRARQIAQFHAAENMIRG
jgi:hypothetical protein